MTFTMFVQTVGEKIRKVTQLMKEKGRQAFIDYENWKRRKEDERLQRLEQMIPIEEKKAKIRAMENKLKNIQQSHRPKPSPTISKGSFNSGTKSMPKIDLFGSSNGDNGKKQSEDMFKKLDGYI